MACALTAGTAFGLLTFELQSSLPAWIDSISNSASGWSLIAVVVVFLLTDDWRRGSILAPAIFVSLNVGYLIGAELSGLTYALGIWSAVGLLAGPFIGAAAALLHHRERRGAQASAFLGGLLIAEALTSYATILATTSWIYWTVVLVAGLLLVAWGIRRAPQPSDRIAALVAGLVTTAVSLVAGVALSQVFYLV